MFQGLRKHYKADRAYRAYNRVEKTVRRAAELISEREFHLEMHQFYKAQVESIDPHREWWDFANNKQKEFDNAMAASQLTKAIDEAKAKIKAARHSFEKAKTAASL